MDQITVPQGTYRLARYPVRKNDNLRAWDAADEYLLQHFAEHTTLDPAAPVLILNDSFGALSVALADYSIQMLSDSFLSHQGTLRNLQNNSLSTKKIRLLSSLEAPTGKFDQVLIKIPKSLALLEDQMHRIRPHIDHDTQIRAAGMVKKIHTSTLKLFESILGPTKTSLARKKSRLIFSTPDMSLNSATPPFPVEYQLDKSDCSLINHANVFSRERLDNGTRFFLEQLTIRPGVRKIIDLGCGNGAVGLIAAQHNPDAELTFVDESFMAVASAKTNFQNCFGDTRTADFQVSDCLSGIAENEFDWVLNNPPFHHQNTMGDAIAWQMFNESNKTLKYGGELWVIGNRHLPYHDKLKRIFGNASVVASNRKFVIVKATKYKKQ